MSERRGLGWHRDLPDVRDHHDQTETVVKVVGHVRRVQKLSAKTSLPPSVDLRPYCSPVEDQGDLGSCVAHASVGLLEYFERRAFGTHVDASRLFVYKTARTLLGWKGDSGAYLRTGMQALATFGAPPEKHWPYKTAATAFDVEPPAFCYAYAQRFRSLEYYRLDPPGRTASDVLATIKQNLVAGLPSMFGFTVYNTIPAIGDGCVDIPFPKRGDRVEGGHAVMCVGYDDKRKINGVAGALLIRNSWGAGWADKGYGWMPYQYVLAGIAADWWSLVRAEFLDISKFE